MMAFGENKVDVYLFCVVYARNHSVLH